MKKRILLIIACIAGNLFLYSQSPTWQWAKEGEGFLMGWPVACDAGGDVYFAGSFARDSATFGSVTMYNSNYEAGTWSGFLCKYSPSGSLLWASDINVPSGSGIYPNAIATDKKPNVSYTGYFIGDSVYFGNTLLLGNNNNSQNYFVVQYDSSGVLQWAHGDGLAGDNQGNGIATDLSGNVYVTGYFNGDTMNFGQAGLRMPLLIDNAFIVKYNVLGNTLWVTGPIPSTGFKSGAEGIGVGTDSSNNVYAVGEFTSDTLTFGSTALIIGDSGQQNLYLVKYDSAANLIWAKTVINDDVSVSNLSAEGNGNFYIAGTLNGDTAVFDSITVYSLGFTCFIAKYNTDGRVLWVRTASDVNSESWAFCVAADKNDNAYLTGGIRGFTICFDSTVLQTDDTGTKPEAAFMYMFNPAGKVNCATILADAIYNFQYNVCTDLFGNAFLGGAFVETPFIFGPDTLTFSNGQNVWVAKFNCSCFSGINNFDYQLSASTLCSGQSALISFSGGSGFSISPSQNVSWIDSLNASLTPDSTTTFTISGYLPCGAYAVQTFTLPVLGTTVAITSNNTAICPNDSAQICAPSGYTNYNWNTGQTRACIYAYTSGAYYVTVSENNLCTATSNQITVYVYTSPPVSTSLDGDTLRAYYGITYQWILNGNIMGGATDSFFIAYAPGAYTVQITDSDGCTATSNPLIIGGINNVADNYISVYPNPSTGAWILSVDNSLIGAQAEVFDAEGRLVYKLEILNAKSEIEFNAASGVYVLRIRSNGFNIAKKLIKM